MNTASDFPTIEPEDVNLPEGVSLGDYVESRVARYETRQLDWDALKFQADFDPKYKRAQMRYMGTGATGVASDTNVITAEHFTFSTMVLPAGCEGPSHIHRDAEEVFFILKGQKIRLFIEHQDEEYETVLSERDLISVPPGVYRGLGRAIAFDAARNGARLVLADIDGDGGNKTADLVMKAGGTARFSKVDLADPGSIKTLAGDINSHEGALHGLVNNGAIATGIGGKAHDEVDIETWDRVMAVNVRGLWLMTTAMAPLLAESGVGRVVNIASDTALWDAPNLLPYVASKGAVMSMTRSLAGELGPQGIGVVAIAPGILTTESTDYVPKARHQLYEQGRAVPGAQSPEDVVGTVSFLLSDAALTLTGQTLPTNRGVVFK